MKTIKILFFIIIISLNSFAISFGEDFNSWVLSFKEHAIKQGISKETLENTMSKVKFLPNVIKYDRYQPEFYEDTITYINKRVTKKKLQNGISLYREKKELINDIENKFLIEKELLLSLMGIETNYGKYLGKMDIVSSLATLSYDKRRSLFFTKELLILLKLIDKNIIEPSTLYGSWAGAFGNFQFMPRTIKDYAIDYNKNSKIELKGIEDSFASAANYMKKIGWKKNEPCYYKINLNNKIPKKYLNTSAKKIKNKKKISFFKKYIKNYEDMNINENFLVGIITPDSDIVKNNDILSPAYIVFDNYEKILKWNRSLRFALAVCTLKNKFKNEL